MRRKVSVKMKLPGYWMDFLRNPLNKKELLAFLTSKVEELKLPPAKATYVTSGQAVVSIGASTPMKNCNHEEADTRVVVHIVHALEQGARTIQVCTVDTDFVAILAGTFHDLIATHPLADIWVAFGISENYRFFHLNAICASLGEPKLRPLPVLHAFSGCDTTSVSTVRARSQFGRPGMLMKTSQRHLCISPVIPSSCWMSTMTISRRSRDRLLSCMTKPVL